MLRRLYVLLLLILPTQAFASSWFCTGTTNHNFQSAFIFHEVSSSSYEMYEVNQRGDHVFKFGGYDLRANKYWLAPALATFDKGNMRMAFLPVRFIPTNSYSWRQIVINPETGSGRYFLKIFQGVVTKDRPNFKPEPPLFEDFVLRCNKF